MTTTMAPVAPTSPTHAPPRGTAPCEGSGARFRDELDRAVQRTGEPAADERPDEDRTVRERPADDRPAAGVAEEGDSPEGDAPDDPATDDAEPSAAPVLVVELPAAIPPPTDAAPSTGEPATTTVEPAGATPGDSTASGPGVDGAAPAEGADGADAISGTRQATLGDGTTAEPEGSDPTQGAAPVTPAPRGVRAASAETAPADPTTVPNARGADAPSTAPATSAGPAGDAAAVSHDAVDPRPTAAPVQEVAPRSAPSPAPTVDLAPAPGADRHAELAQQVLRTEELAESLRASFRRGERDTSLSIQLHPAELGAVRVEARLVDGVTHLVLRADHPAALDRLSAALDHLRADLAGNGVDVGDLELHHGGAGGERDGDGPTHGASRAEGTPVDPTPRGSDRPDRTATLPGGSLSLDL